MCGTLGKATLGGSKSGLIYSLLKDNSRYIAAQVMCRMSKFSARWLTNYGMSLGLGDVTPDFMLTEYKQELIEKEFKKCDELIDSYKKGELTLKTGCNAEETLESDLLKILNDIREDAGKYCFKNLPSNNSALIMAVCGSKGSNLNLCQMIACVGQQAVSGERIPNGFTSRSLPHFEINSKEPKARGFVSNSFYTGLTPPEFFFHTMAGREGLIDTAVKTADTGYMQRRLIKALEDVVVSYDGTVRNSEGCIVQFRYGDDGLDPVHIEKDEFPFDLNRLLNYVRSFYPRNPKDKVLTIRKILGIELQYINNFKADQNIVFVERYYEYIREFFVDYCKQIESYNNLMGNEPDHASYSINIGLTQRQLDLYFKRLKEKILLARVVPGEGIGATSAQSIGEPCTQMTLKTFHFAGVASMNVTLGVPRIKEIINASTNIATPIIEVQLKNSRDVVVAGLVKNEINVVHLRDICKSIAEVYEAEGCYLEVKLDKTTMEKKYFGINVNQVANSIIKGKLKIKEKHLSIQTQYKFRIEPYDTNEREMIFVMKSLRKKLQDVKVGGIPTIKRALISKKMKNGQDEFCIFAEGFGLASIFMIPQVDFTKTITNHIIEVNEVLGIEAARLMIIKQIQYTIGIYAIKVNIRHINVLADVMTGKGKVHGITRYGIAKMKDSTIMLASFEKTSDILFDAAYFGKEDHVRGVSENIIVGSQMTIGTGSFSLMYNIPGVNRKKLKLTEGVMGI